MATRIQMRQVIGLLEALASAGAIPAFIDLTDVPGNYTGDSLKVVRVNVGETGLEFASISSGYTVIPVAASPYTVIPVTGQHIYNVDTSGGSITINMPTAIGNTAEYTINNRGSNSVIIDPFGAQTINTNANQTLLFLNTSVDVYSDNANLFIR